MEKARLDTHQLAGLDDRERGFSRPIEFERAGEEYRAVLRYETVRLSTDPDATQDGALLRLIELLHSRGYRQLRTQVSIRNGVYLGSQEPWLDYRDPLTPVAASPGFLARVMGWFRPRTTNQQP
jgi:hypothetical protein